MIFYKYNWAICSQNWDQSITQSEYKKATITYDKEYEVAVTEDVTEQITDTDAKGNTIILGTRVVKKPVVDKEGNAVVTKEVREVKYNPYNWFVIIPDDATVLTEEEYKAELEKL